MSLSDDIEAKRRELNHLKQISSLTKRLKTQLDDLSDQVGQMNENAQTVQEVMSNWDCVLRSISQASISLLQYSENDYETGKWANVSANGKGKKAARGDAESGSEDGSVDERVDMQQESGPPLPETLVRVKVNEEEV